jgi:hypothetical protein
MTPRIQFDFSSIDPRHRALIIGGVVVIILAIVGLIFFRPGGDETADITVTPTVSPTASPSMIPSLGPATSTPTQGPTATLEPYSYEVQPGETLLFIIQIFGYRDTAVIPEVIALNGMASENDLVAGATILIPRQTPTVGPTFTVTATLDPIVTPSATGTAGPTTDPNITPDYTECSPEHRCLSPDGNYWIHVVRAGDTIAAIAFQYDSKPDCLIRENGLPPTDPVIFEGQQIKVCILVTQTPTLTPTGGPDSTATALPTPSAPSLLAPAQNASIAHSQTVTLQWAGSRPLSAGQSYLIILKNVDTGEETRYVTRSSAYKLPGSLKAGEYEWRVVIVSGNSPDAPVVSGPGETRRFTWR